MQEGNLAEQGVKEKLVGAGRGGGSNGEKWREGKEGGISSLPHGEQEKELVGGGGKMGTLSSAKVISRARKKRQKEVRRCNVV